MRLPSERFRWRASRPLIALLTLCAAGCGSGAGSNQGSSGGSPNTADGGAAGMLDAPGAAGGTEPAQFASTTQLWIGTPDDKATIVVYVLSKPTSCSLLSAHGWDARLAAGTQHLELKEFGTGPGSYTVVTTKTPAPGEAAVNYSINDSGNPVETSGSGGLVTIASLNAGKDVTGNYDLMFGSTPISGAFDAAYCAGGVEP